MAATQEEPTTAEVVDAAQRSLMRKLIPWLMQQGEWPLLFLQDRQTRRATSREVAKALYSIPTRLVAPAERDEAGKTR